MRLGQQPLELGVLLLKFPQPPRIRHVHAAEAGAPLVERGVAEAALPAQLLDRHPGLALLQEPNDLFLAESALLHVRHSPERRTPRTSRWYGWRGAGQTDRRLRPATTSILLL